MGWGVGEWDRNGEVGALTQAEQGPAEGGPWRRSPGMNHQGAMPTQEGQSVSLYHRTIFISSTALATIRGNYLYSFISLVSTRR